MSLLISAAQRPDHWGSYQFKSCQVPCGRSKSSVRPWTENSMFNMTVTWFTGSNSQHTQTMKTCSLILWHGDQGQQDWNLGQSVLVTITASPITLQLSLILPFYRWGSEILCNLPKVTQWWLELKLVDSKIHSHLPAYPSPCPCLSLSFSLITQTHTHFIHIYLHFYLLLFFNLKKKKRVLGTNRIPEDNLHSTGGGSMLSCTSLQIKTELKIFKVQFKVLST